MISDQDQKALGLRTIEGKFDREVVCIRRGDHRLDCLIVGPVRAADPNILSRREQSGGWKLLFMARRSEVARVEE